MKAGERQAAALLDRFFEILGLGRVDAAGGLLADGVEFHIIGRPGVVPLAGIYRGKEEVLGYLVSFLEANNPADMLVQFHLEDAGESRRASSHVNIVSEVRSTGKRYDLEFLYKWELDDALDKIRGMTLYYSTWHLTEAFTEGGDGFVTDQRGTDDFGIIPVGFDTTALAAGLYDGFYVRHDVPGTLAFLSDDVVLVEKGNPALPSNGAYYGKAGFQQLITGVFCYQIYLSPPAFRNYITRGNRTDVTLDVHFGDAVTGKNFFITLNQSLIFDVKGRLLELKSYHDSQEIWMNHLPD